MTKHLPLCELQDEIYSNKDRSDTINRLFMKKSTLTNRLALGAILFITVVLVLQQWMGSNNFLAQVDGGAGSSADDCTIQLFSAVEEATGENVDIEQDLTLEVTVGNCPSSLPPETNGFCCMKYMKEEWQSIITSFKNDGVTNKNKGKVVDFYIKWALTKVKCTGVSPLETPLSHSGGDEDNPFQITGDHCTTDSGIYAYKESVILTQFTDPKATIYPGESTAWKEAYCLPPDGESAVTCGNCRGFTCDDFTEDNGSESSISSDSSTSSESSSSSKSSDSSSSYRAACCVFTNNWLGDGKDKSHCHWDYSEEDCTQEYAKSYYYSADHEIRVMQTKWYDSWDTCKNVEYTEPYPNCGYIDDTGSESSKSSESSTSSVSSEIKKYCCATKKEKNGVWEDNLECPTEPMTEDECHDSDKYNGKEEMYDDHSNCYEACKGSSSSESSGSSESSNSSSSIEEGYCCLYKDYTKIDLKKMTMCLSTDPYDKKERCTKEKEQASLDARDSPIKAITVKWYASRKDCWEAEKTNCEYTVPSISSTPSSPKSSDPSSSSDSSKSSESSDSSDSSFSHSASSRRRWRAVAEYKNTDAGKRDGYCCASPPPGQKYKPEIDCKKKTFKSICDAATAGTDMDGEGWYEEKSDCTYACQKSSESSVSSEESSGSSVSSEERNPACCGLERAYPYPDEKTSPPLKNKDGSITTKYECIDLTNAGALKEIKKNCIDTSENGLSGKWFSQMEDCEVDLIYYKGRCGPIGTCCVPAKTSGIVTGGTVPHTVVVTDDESACFLANEQMYSGIFGTIKATESDCGKINGKWEANDSDKAKCNASKANNCGAGFSSSSESSRSNVSSVSSEETSSSSEDNPACCQRGYKGSEFDDWRCQEIKQGLAEDDFNLEKKQEECEADQASNTMGMNGKWFSKMSDCEALGGNMRYVCAEPRACCGLVYDFVGGDYSEKVSTGTYSCQENPPITNNQEYVLYKNQCEGERLKGRFFESMGDCEETLNKTNPKGKNCVSTKQLAN